MTIQNSKFRILVGAILVWVWGMTRLMHPAHSAQDMEQTEMVAP